MAKKNVHQDTDILINVLLDRSGSMASLVGDVIGHYNTFIKEQAAIPGKATVSLVLFDTAYEEIYIGRDISEVPVLDNKTYSARGSTALLDSLGKFILAVDAIKNKPKKILFLINTDGFENASREFTKKQIKDLITERQSNHDWQFLFIGAGIDAFSENTGAGLGLNYWQTFTSSPSAAGMSNTSNYSSSVTTTYRTTDLTGENLFNTALDNADLVDDSLAPKSAGNTADKKKRKTPSAK